MAKQNNPTGNKGLSVNLLPKFYQTPANKKFLQATLDQLFQPGTVTKTNGFIGRQNAKAATGNDIYVKANSLDRQNYQLEPGLVITDAIGNTTFFKDYIDYINQVSTLGGNTLRHERLNKQEFYSWDPHINWDKIVNFQNYYWLPYGPEVIKIYGHQAAATSTYGVKIQNAGNTSEYVFTPDGLTPSPMLKLYRGQTYLFNIISPGNPFSFKTERSIGPANRYHTSGINFYGVEQGTITFTVPEDAPSILYYQSETDLNLGGSIAIFNSEDATVLDVENEILGKQRYILADGTPLSNGMKLSFGGTVTPEKYASGQYYVEGVGIAIKLVPEIDLYTSSPYVTDATIEFDTVPFDVEPFSDASGYSGKIDYITINRASRDRNQWSRYNRWFHQEVIKASSAHNGNIASLDQEARAKRPIIEFEADLQLFNMGSTSIPDIDLVDTHTKDIFSIIEGTKGYNVDGVQLTDGQRVLFTADTDPLATNRIYTVTMVNISGYNQIRLVADPDPVKGQSVLIKYGKENHGMVYWYNGVSWQLGQQKLEVNQSPLFDIVDNDGISFSDNSVYNGSTFAGTPIFSYKRASGGTADTVLGIPLSYQNVSNIGDIVFDFNLSTDTFQYKKSNVVVTQGVGVGYLTSYDYSGNPSYVNGWQASEVDYIQFAIQVYKNSGKVNDFAISMFDNTAALALDSDDIRVYVNDVRCNTSTWSLVVGSKYLVVKFNSDVKLTDVVTIKVHTNQPVNDKGFYEIPINLQNNPLNESPKNFTLGEIINHVDSIIDNIYEFNENGVPTVALDNVRGHISSGAFVGVFPGVSNLHDLGNVTKYGTKFVQHSGPLSLAAYHLTSDKNDVINAIKSSRDDYADFKRNFIASSETLGKDASADIMVDLILTKMFNNTPDTAPYYFTDMVPFGAKIVSNLTVVDYRIKKYPLSQAFSLDGLSNKAVGIYLNGTQLTHGRDYTFDGQGGFDMLATIANGDTLTTYEYDNTDGCFVPATPTKLGMWPKYEPKIYLDTTLVNPQMMIQGHDGSLIAAYGDYRDQLLLELEKRIYNNIKIEYDTSIFDVNSLLPGINRPADYTLSEINEILAPHFYSWSKLIGVDYTKSLNFDRSNSFTFNYSANSAPDGSPLPGFWRGVYRWLLDTDRPHLCPWEMLGFSVEPSWWTSVYGPAPYTRDNLILWEDLAAGVLRKPNTPAVKLAGYARPFLMDCIPVDESGKLLSPIHSGLASGIITQNINNNFVFGDVGPVENAWRRSSHYAFSVIMSFILMNPAGTIGLLIDRSRVVRNKAGQLIYSETGLRIRPADVVVPSVYTSPTRIQTAGLVNYIVDHLLHFVFSNNVVTYGAYSSDLSNLGVQLSYRVGAFTNKSQFNLLLESKTPSSTGSVFVPAEDYNIFLNQSSPIKKISYSGIMVTRLSTGYEVSGYSHTTPYFNTYSYTRDGSTLNVGGISASYSVWVPGQNYVTGAIVKYGNSFYRSISNTATATFTTDAFTPISALPVVGGVTVTLRSGWDKSKPVAVPYGTLFETPQEVVDFILGYGEYLKDQGFVFDEFNANLGLVANWETSAKEFLFWTTQNWTVGSDKWSDWIPNQPVTYGSIVRYNGDYYSAIYNIPSEDTFNPDNYNKLDGLSDIGSSIISLSPAANGISFNVDMAVVDDIGNTVNDYEIFKVDGTPIPLVNLTSDFDGSVITYRTVTEEGIYNASFYLVQHEHVVVINNTTIFNDVIYNPESGYRRERVKVSGYITIDWDGSLNIPGFIFDQATVMAWQQWQDYNMGDVIKHQGHYYSANKFTPGTPTFVASDWVRLDSKPTPNILPNWTNIATQFTDFYSLDIDSFDAKQQAVAQHLVGYQKRQYLNNIIQDDVSEFKFYQGMIREKGTKNVLNKLFGVLESDNLESLVFYEEWALRVGQYGASSAFESIEFVLEEDKFKSNPQGVVLTNSVDRSLSPFIIQQTPNNVYLKPLGYNSKPFPTLSTVNSYFRPAGHVDSKDVAVSLGKLEEIVGYDITEFSNGSYVWCAFEGPSWNIYRFTDTGVNVRSVTYLNKVLTVEMESMIPIQVGSVVGLAEVSMLNGFYVVTSVAHNTFTVAANIIDFPNPFTSNNELVVFVFASQHAQSIDDIDTILPLHIDNGSLLWTDDGGNGKWATWEYGQVYEGSVITDSEPAANLAYGYTVAMNGNADIIGVGSAAGTVTIYDKVGTSVPWVNRQLVQEPLLSLPPVLNEHVASVISFSNDGSWMVTGSPLANSVVTKYVGEFVDGPTYVAGKVVGIRVNGRISQYYKALVDTTQTPSATATDWAQLESPLSSTESPNYVGEFVGGSVIYAAKDIVSMSANGKIVAYYRAAVATTQTPSSTASDWEVLSYVPVQIRGTRSGAMNQGAISIYSKTKSNIFVLEDTIVSPSPADFENEKFGSSIALNNDVMYVGATGTGRIYRLTYKSVVRISTRYNPLGSAHATIQVESTRGIRVGMYITCVTTPGAFTGGQHVIQVVNSTTLILSGSPNATPSGQLNFSTLSWEYDLDNVLEPANYVNGGIFVLSKDGSTLAVSGQGSVIVYDTTTLTPIATLTGETAKFGSSVSISDDGSYLVISDIDSNVYGTQAGVISIYNKTTTYRQNRSVTEYTKVQDLKNRLPELGGRFGTKVSFMNNYKTVVVVSQEADTLVQSVFDADTTTFDHKLTKFMTKKLDNGRVDVYDRYGSKWVFSESLTNGTVMGDSYGMGFAVGENTIVVSAPYATDTVIRSGLVFNYTKAAGDYTWTIKRQEGPSVDISKIKKAFLYNKDTGQLIKHLDVIDPLQGKIAGAAEEEISLKTFYDPAVYTVGNELVTVNETSYWSTAHVGKLWWDLRTTKFLDTTFDDAEYKINKWNTLAPGASVDIYEWVETKLKPSAWDALTDTPAGIAKGISGTSLYGDEAYSVTKRYDSVSKTFYNTYYYWVKNRRIVPAVPGRNITAKEVASLITNPRGQGYTYLALTGENSFSLVNAQQYLADSSVVCSLEYWVIDSTDKNVHSQWKLISNDTIVDLPKTIEQKWIDSLCGIDTAGRLVPDPSLPVKLRYGIENRPRQSMFVNRVEALKQMIERVNRVLKDVQVVESYDLTSLESYDAYPTVSSQTGQFYDQVVDTYADLAYVNISAFKRPSLTPVIVDGRITSVKVSSYGSGYITPPTVTVVGSGEGAIVQYTAVNSIEVVNSGEGYDSTTALMVRDFSVLVKNDVNAGGNWSVYSYDPVGKEWSRVLTQSYDVRQYWEYTDWFDSAKGYNQFTAADYAVSTFVDLNAINPEVGELVKVNTASSGGWILLEKYSDVVSVDWTQVYQVVGIQNGTIQFKSSLYKFASTDVGYDASTFDGGSFDIVASTELRIILNTIKDKLFIGELKQQYLDLFIASIHYAHSEQVFIDWAFKTSFVRATHKVGQLSQPVNYPVNNLPNFQDYINEVKPYRTKVREYVSNYSGVPQADGVDWNYSAVSDFDLRTVYENGKVIPVNAKVINNAIVVNDPIIQQDPWKQWYNNVGFEVTELRIIDGGYGYNSPPAVSIVGGGGEGATAQAFITDGVVTRLVLITKGSGYLSTPTIEFTGGLAASDSASARAVAIIGKGVVRSSLIAMKFDRTSGAYAVTDLNVTQTFNHTSMVYNLDWAPDVAIGKSSVFIDGIPVLRELFTLGVVTSTNNGYTQYTGKLTFKAAVNVKNTIVIKYMKDVVLLNAADRIHHFYNPATGSLGKDLSQLMTGVDYGGVQVSGLSFEVSSGWDELPYGAEAWDVYDHTYTDYAIEVQAGVHEVVLPYVPADGMVLNVYYSKNQQEVYPITVDNASQLEFAYSTAIETPVVTVVNTGTTTSDVTVKNGLVVINRTSVLTVNDTSKLREGDAVSVASGALVYGTVIKSIDSPTQITLNQVIFNNIPSGSALTFTRTINVPEVLMVKVGLMAFASPVTVGSTVVISGMIDPIRLDDLNYGSSEQTNSNAIMSSPIGDGITDVVTIPSGFVINTGDILTVRQSTSDGAIVPQSSQYDTDITGGDLAYSSARGIAADEIVIDGDGFVTETTSSAPEEVVPGQVVDTLSIKVFDQPAAGSAAVKVDKYIADGVKTKYKVSQLPNSGSALIVKIDDVIMSQGVDYTFDYPTMQVVFKELPAQGSEIVVFSIGFSGTNVLDVDYFVGDGTTAEFITRAKWVSKFTALVYINGLVADPLFIRTNTDYDVTNMIGLQFSQAPAAGDIISFIIVSGTQQTFAITNTEVITGNGGRTYKLENLVGKSLPNESNMIVRVGQQILEAPNNSYFDIKDNILEYMIEPTKFLPGTVDVRSIKVYAGGDILKQGNDFVADLTGITIKINKRIYKKYVGKELVVSIISDQAYTYNPDTNEITFTQDYDSNTTIEVMSSYVHDVMGIQRTSVNVTASYQLTPDTVEFYRYREILGGNIALNRPVLNDNYVWVVKNGILLSPSIDYRLNGDKQSIQMAQALAVTDTITLITFGTNVLSSDGIAYMQFKDMTNRVSYIRLSKNKQTTLAVDLKWNDTTITLVDGSNFSTPDASTNNPGVIEIRGERIEYFAKSGNVLSKLRRGTMGTGVYSNNLAGAVVQDIGRDEIIPYTDSVLTKHIVSDGTNTVQMPFVPTSVNDFEIFVGGYDTSTVWESGMEYTAGEYITIGTYTYKCIADHTSSTSFNADIGNWQFFIGNIRLKKAAYTVFNANKAPYSPAGDVTFPADFALVFDETGAVTNKLQLTTPVSIGTRITVVKKTGISWDGKNNIGILNDDGKVASFIKAQSGISYQQYK